MYNGIGICFDGSNHNGYIQRNYQHFRYVKERVGFKPEEQNGEPRNTWYEVPDVSSLSEDRTYKVELKCMELRELMEEQGYGPQDIEKKISRFRKALLLKEAVVATAEKSAVYFNSSGKQITKEAAESMSFAKEDSSNSVGDRKRGLDDTSKEGKSDEENMPAKKKKKKKKTKKSDLHAPLSESKKVKRKKGKKKKSSSHRKKDR